MSLRMSRWLTFVNVLGLTDAWIWIGKWFFQPDLPDVTLALPKKCRLAYKFIYSYCKPITGSLWGGDGRTWLSSCTKYFVHCLFYCFNVTLILLGWGEPVLSLYHARSWTGVMAPNPVWLYTSTEGRLAACFCFATSERGACVNLLLEKHMSCSAPGQ